MQHLISSSSGRWKHWPLLIAALLGMAIYASTLGGTYIYDDTAVALGDQRLHDPSLWKYYWTRDYYYNVKNEAGAADNLYRPLASMSFAIPVYLLGDRPMVLHGMNILLYGGCCALAAAMARRIGGTRLAWVGGLLFAAHPIHVEVVAGLVGRAEMMAMLGIAGAITLHIGGRPSFGRSTGILACTLLAMLSKEQGVLIAALLLAAEPLRRRLHPAALPADATPAVDRRRLSPLQLEILGICMLTAAYIVLREQVLHLKFWWDRSYLDSVMQPLILPDADRLRMPIVLLGRYTWQLLWPQYLSIDYSGLSIGWTTSWHDPYLWLGLCVFVTGAIALAIALWHRAWAAVLLLVGLGLTYGMVSNAAALIGTLYGERLMFIPSLFFLLLVGMGLLRLPRRAALPIAIGATALGGLWATRYAVRWNDRLTFYERSLADNPRSMRLHQVLAAELKDRGRLADAAAVAQSGRDLMPTYWNIVLQCAEIAEARGDLAEASRLFTTAAHLKPELGAAALTEYHSRHPTTATSQPAQ